MLILLSGHSKMRATANFFIRPLISTDDMKEPSHEFVFQTATNARLFKTLVENLIKSTTSEITPSQIILKNTWKESTVLVPNQLLKDRKNLYALAIATIDTSIQFNTENIETVLAQTRALKLQVQKKKLAFIKRLKKTLESYYHDFYFLSKERCPYNQSFLFSPILTPEGAYVSASGLSYYLEQMIVDLTIPYIGDQPFSLDNCKLVDDPEKNQNIRNSLLTQLLKNDFFKSNQKMTEKILDEHIKEQKEIANNLLQDSVLEKKLENALIKRKLLQPQLASFVVYDGSPGQNHPLRMDLCTLINTHILPKEAQCEPNTRIFLFNRHDIQNTVSSTKLGRWVLSFPNKNAAEAFCKHADIQSLSIIETPWEYISEYIAKCDLVLMSSLPKKETYQKLSTEALFCYAIIDENFYYLDIQQQNYYKIELAEEKLIELKKNFNIKPNNLYPSKYIASSEEGLTIQYAKQTLSEEELKKITTITNHNHIKNNQLQRHCYGISLSDLQLLQLVTTLPKMEDIWNFKRHKLSSYYWGLFYSIKKVLALNDNFKPQDTASLISVEESFLEVLHSPELSKETRLFDLQQFIQAHPNVISSIAKLAALLNVCYLRFEFTPEQIFTLLKYCYQNNPASLKLNGNEEIGYFLASLPIFLWHPGLIFLATAGKTEKNNLINTKKDNDETLKKYLTNIIKNSHVLAAVLNHLSQKKQIAFISTIKKYKILLSNKLLDTAENAGTVLTVIPWEIWQHHFKFPLCQVVEQKTHLIEILILAKQPEKQEKILEELGIDCLTTHFQESSIQKISLEKLSPPNCLTYLKLLYPQLGTPSASEFAQFLENLPTEEWLNLLHKIEIKQFIFNDFYKILIHLKYKNWDSLSQLVLQKKVAELINNEKIFIIKYIISVLEPTQWKEPVVLLDIPEKTLKDWFIKDKIRLGRFLNIVSPAYWADFFTFFSQDKEAWTEFLRRLIDEEEFFSVILLDNLSHFNQLILLNYLIESLGEKSFLSKFPINSTLLLNYIQLNHRAINIPTPIFLRNLAQLLPHLFDDKIWVSLSPIAQENINNIITDGADFARLLSALPLEQWQTFLNKKISDSYVKNLIFLNSKELGKFLNELPSNQWHQFFEIYGWPQWGTYWPKWEDFFRELENIVEQLSPHLQDVFFEFFSHYNNVIKITDTNFLKNLVSYFSCKKTKDSTNGYNKFLQKILWHFSANGQLQKMIPNDFTLGRVLVHTEESHDPLLMQVLAEHLPKILKSSEHIRAMFHAVMTKETKKSEDRQKALFNLLDDTLLKILYDNKTLLDIIDVFKQFSFELQKTIIARLLKIPALSHLTKLPIKFNNTLFKILYEVGHKNYCGADFSNCRLEDYDLSEFDFSNAKVDGLTFRKVKLNQTSFQSLYNAGCRDFSHTILLEDIDLKNYDILDIDFTNTDFTQCTLHNLELANNKAIDIIVQNANQLNTSFESSEFFKKLCVQIYNCYALDKATKSAKLIDTFIEKLQQFPYEAYLYFIKIFSLQENNNFDLKKFIKNELANFLIYNLKNSLKNTYKKNDNEIKEIQQTMMFFLVSNQFTINHIELFLELPEKFLTHQLLEQACLLIEKSLKDTQFLSTHFYFVTKLLKACYAEDNILSHRFISFSFTKTKHFLSLLEKTFLQNTNEKLNIHKLIIVTVLCDIWLKSNKFEEQFFLLEYANSLTSEDIITATFEKLDIPTAARNCLNNGKLAASKHINAIKSSYESDRQNRSSLYTFFSTSINFDKTKKTLTLITQQLARSNRQGANDAKLTIAKFLCDTWLKSNKFEEQFFLIEYASSLTSKNSIRDILEKLDIPSAARNCLTIKWDVLLNRNNEMHIGSFFGL